MKRNLPAQQDQERDSRFRERMSTAVVIIRRCRAIRKYHSLIHSCRHRFAPAARFHTSVMMRVAVFSNTSLCLPVFVHPVIRGASVLAVTAENGNGSHAEPCQTGAPGMFPAASGPIAPADDGDRASATYLNLNSSIRCRNPATLSLIKEIGGYVVLRREQNAQSDISRDGIAAPGGLEPERLPSQGVKRLSLCVVWRSCPIRLISGRCLLCFHLPTHDSHLLSLCYKVPRHFQGQRLPCGASFAVTSAREAMIPHSPAIPLPSSAIRATGSSWDDKRTFWPSPGNRRSFGGLLAEHMAESSPQQRLPQPLRKPRPRLPWRRRRRRRAPGVFPACTTPGRYHAGRGNPAHSAVIYSGGGILAPSC